MGGGKLSVSGGESLAQRVNLGFHCCCDQSRDDIHSAKFVMMFRHFLVCEAKKHTPWRCEVNNVCFRICSDAV